MLFILNGVILIPISELKHLLVINKNLTETTSRCRKLVIDQQIEEPHAKILHNIANIFLLGQLLFYDALGL